MGVEFKQDCRAITIFELLVVLAIIGVVFGLTVRSWDIWLVTHRVQRIAIQLSQTIQYARHVACYHHETIRLCGSRDQQHCDGQWSEGYVVKIQSSPSVLWHGAKNSPDYRLIWKSSFSQNAFLDFTAQGLTAGQQGTFYICPPQRYARLARAWVITRSGRLRYLSAKVYASCSV